MASSNPTKVRSRTVLHVCMCAWVYATNGCACVYPYERACASALCLRVRAHGNCVRVRRRAVSVRTCVHVRISTAYLVVNHAQSNPHGFVAGVVGLCLKQNLLRAIISIHLQTEQTEVTERHSSPTLRHNKHKQSDSDTTDGEKTTQRIHPRCCGRKVQG